MMNWTLFYFYFGFLFFFSFLFGFICAQNSVSDLVLYNGLNYIKNPWLLLSIFIV